MRPIIFQGLDVGTGGGIYFCAIAAKHFGWKMIGTEANKDDFEVAQTNVSKNHLENTIKVIHTEDETKIFPEAIFDSSPSITFSVCNPPFFEASEPRQDRNVFDEKDAGREHEMAVEGYCKIAHIFL
jgi:23S rRNA A1618 N6-methylase RlmF